MLVSPRRVALDLLGQVLGAHRPLDELLERDPALGILEGRDRAFVHLMVATCLRRLGQIDAAIDHCVSRPLPVKAAEARNLLRLGLTQLLFLGTPAHAAVGETVALADSAELGGYKGLINAVLRRLASEGAALIATQDAGLLDTPDWLWRSWQGAYGVEGARAIALAHLSEAPLDLTVKSDAEGWARTLGGAVLPTGSVRIPAGGDVRSMAGFADGAWWVQDAAAALPARLLGDVKAKRVIDLCAAPGGKTAQLALAGAAVTAIDRSAPRLKRIADNLARLKLAAELIPADAARWRPDIPADGVLLDAPCSATGTIRRHPDIARIKTPGDVARMAAQQERLLAAAAAMVAPGGVLVYAVCSLEAVEGPERIAAFLASTPGFRRRAIHPSELGNEAQLIDAAGDLRTLPSHWPARSGLDGFYACRLEKL